MIWYDMIWYDMIGAEFRVFMLFSVAIRSVIRITWSSLYFILLQIQWSAMQCD